MDLLKDSAYKLTQFSQEQIQTLENSIIEKETRGKITPYVMCLIRDKEIKLTPEEAVRQLYLMVLLNDLNYPRNRIALLECDINFFFSQRKLLNVHDF